MLKLEDHVTNLINTYPNVALQTNVIHWLNVKVTTKFVNVNTWNVPLWLTVFNLIQKSWKRHSTRYARPQSPTSERQLKVRGPQLREPGGASCLGHPETNAILFPVRHYMSSMAFVPWFIVCGVDSWSNCGVNRKLLISAICWCVFHSLLNLHVAGNNLNVKTLFSYLPELKFCPLLFTWIRLLGVCCRYTLKAGRLCHQLL